MQDRIRGVDRQQVRERWDEATDEEQQEGHHRHAVYRVDVVLCLAADQNLGLDPAIEAIGMLVALEHERRGPDAVRCFR
ncbi:hypothetical protein HRbin26_00487 [bacterium HR26]|nr:hypothetical protein HRbin26_00487 [bacterium HR26]